MDRPAAGRGRSGVDRRSHQQLLPAHRGRPAKRLQHLLLRGLRPGQRVALRGRGRRADFGRGDGRLWRDGRPAGAPAAGSFSPPGEGQPGRCDRLERALGRGGPGVAGDRRGSDPGALPVLRGPAARDLRAVRDTALAPRPARSRGRQPPPGTRGGHGGRDGDAGAGGRRRRGGRRHAGSGNQRDRSRRPGGELRVRLPRRHLALPEPHHAAIRACRLAGCRSRRGAGPGGRVRRLQLLPLPRLRSRSAAPGRGICR